MVLRRSAIELFQQGKTQKFIVQALGVSQPTVSRWIKAFKEKGKASLARPLLGGSRRKLAPEQLEQLSKILDEGAEQHGFKDNVWTRARVKELIKRKFGVTYQVRSLSDLPRDLGYTLQKPERSSYRQDPQKVRQWKEHILPG